MLESALFVLILPLILWLLYWYYTTSYYERYLKDIPGPKPLPLLGNALECRNLCDILPKTLNCMKEYNGNFKIYIGTQPQLIVCEPKDVAFFLSSPSIISKSNIYDTIQPYFGFGLLTSNGQRWKKHRKLLTPAFHFKILEEFVDVFDSASDILIEKLKSLTDKSTVNISPFIARCALDIICESTMGTSVDAQNDTESAYVKNLDMMSKLVLQRMVNPILLNSFFYLFSTINWKTRKALEVVHNYTRSVTSRRKIEFFNNAKHLRPDAASFGKKKRLAFLDLILEYSLEDPSFTEHDIQQEVDTFMAAGYDTVATTMSFVFYSLATNPEVQRKAYAELQTIFADDPERGATYRDLQEMKYLEMVIKETLRIYTTAAIYGRVLDEDVNCNGKMLPKGLMVYIFAYGIHHSDAYEDPEVFNPERFSVENSINRNPFTYLPFSAGPRSCIGQKFAMLEMKSVISKVLRNFNLVLAEADYKLVLKLGIVLGCEKPFLLRLEERN